ncbi:PDR/VanB family oxidoreductase [Labrys okinawensis]|uniref:PDR/VanB family oxidoreductase n=1 Tax=Labrys okinawensis TaxID=346911 RepID=UPI0039BD8740
MNQHRSISKKYFEVEVVKISREAADVKSINLKVRRRDEAVETEPGSHIGIHLPDIGIRQYSIIGGGGGEYKIAVYREAEGRGGSRYLHESVHVGDILLCEPPRNTFPLSFDAQSYKLIAGGIGITAILPMARELWTRGKSFALTYLARDPDKAAFVDELLQAPFRGSVNIHYSALSGRADMRSIVGHAFDGSRIYCCGPQKLLDAVLRATEGWPTCAVNFERFAAPSLDTKGRAFHVRLASGVEYLVPFDKTILQVLRENGLEVPSMCERGVCGSCLAPVTEGIPDHKDTTLSPQEKLANDVIAICCSRAKSETICLDI